MNPVKEELRSYFNEGPLSKLSIVLMGVFAVVALFKVIQHLSGIPVADGLLSYLVLPASPSELLWKPWTLLTYSFVHEGFLHLLFNLLYLFFAGRLFVDFLGAQRLIPVFILGALAGGALYVLSYNLFPALRGMLPSANLRGASAGVMSVLFALTTKAPGLKVRLFFVLDVKLWMIALLLLLIDLAYLPEGNAGGHLAHLGGAALGYVIVRQLDRGRDWTRGIAHLLDSGDAFLQTGKRSRLRVVKPFVGEKPMRPAANLPAQNQEQLDALLDKISRSGYDSLSKEEKELLFKMSQK